MNWTTNLITNLSALLVTLALAGCALDRQVRDGAIHANLIPIVQPVPFGDRFTLEEQAICCVGMDDDLVALASAFQASVVA